MDRPQNWTTTEESVIFIAEVKAFLITRDQSTTQLECSHVIVRRHENDEHKIVMYNYTERRRSEVSIFIILEIASEIANLLKIIKISPCI